MKQLKFTNRYQQLGNDFYQNQQPTSIKKPHLININPLMLNELDIDESTIDHEFFTDISSGNAMLEDAQPSSFIYAGHQFGHFVPQLGDGRAILLGEIQNKNGRYWELQLKGAGLTPFSRDGDGRAVLRSTIREYLCSEAMAALHIPTTRSLSIVGSEEKVFRENIETGSVMIRMSPSFIRFGSFELFASRGQHRQIKQLADFVIRHYYQDIDLRSTDYNPYQKWLEKVVNKTAELIAAWQAEGFAHGVMNTDNMSILGLTIDYGPFAFLDNYDSQFICNHSDHQGRYRFENQPSIAFWNLNCLARSVLDLMDVEEAKQALSGYEKDYNRYYLKLMQNKSGLFEKNDKQHEALIFSLLNIMQEQQVDYSLFFRKLADFEFDQVSRQANSDLLELFNDADTFNQWAGEYHQNLKSQPLSAEARKEKMNSINPKYILRNYIAQMIIERAEQQQDYAYLDQWLKVLQNPYDEHPEMAEYAGHPPAWAGQISVSCSS
ncbi:MAG: YdiU family protein [gamma proteobacterium symbiont of Taylorina sp.]|nr:YdiU family protein [gamma proteobacterium symbiont of Taylorina sp.]